MRRGWLVSVLILLAMLVGALLISRGRQVPRLPPSTTQPVDVTRGKLALILGGDEEYATSSSCHDCHADQHESWHQTYHRTMTQAATSASIAAPVGEFFLSSHGREFVITRTNNDFWVDMPDPEWERQMQLRNADLSRIANTPRVKRRIVMTTGSHHYQAYWIHGSAGADLHQVPFVYHLEEARWIPKESSFLHDPNSKAEFAVWNHNCIQCHSVAGQPRLNMRTGRFASHVVELGIACEACHGPSTEHVQLARRAALGGTAEDADVTGLTVNPQRLTKQRSAEVCGQCHGSFFPKNTTDWWESGWRGQYRPGEELEATRTLLRHITSSYDPKTQERFDQAGDSLYWQDGTARVGGREFLGLIESGCYQRGEMTCLSCHSMHDYMDPDDQLAKKMDGNQACLQCHEPMRERIEEHTHHLPDSSGSQCYNCHMPHTSYALFKAIRSHRIDSPSAKTTWKTGRPNACNLCHLDRTLAWTAENLSRWYGQPPVDLDAERQEISDTAIWLLRGDAAQRSIAVWATGWEPARETAGTQWMAPYLTQLMQDPYPVIRLMAHRSLRTLAGFEDFNYDFLGRPDEREKSRRAILELWKKVAGAKQEQAVALLLNADGSVNWPVFNQLLTERDDHPVSISE